MHKVIGIRGPNGAGKTTLARALMEKANYIIQVTVAGSLVNVFDKFVVPGSYKRVCGGCDTLEYKNVHPTILECALFSPVIYEGVLVGTTFEPTLKLNDELSFQGSRLILVCLDVTLNEAIDNVNRRRAAEDKSAIGKTDNIEISYKKHLSSARKLHAAGVSIMWLPFNDALTYIEEELGL